MRPVWSMDMYCNFCGGRIRRGKHKPQSADAQALFCNEECRLKMLLKSEPNTCWFCSSHEEVSFDTAAHADMYSDLNVSYGTRRWNAHVVSIPRCRRCSANHKKVRRTVLITEVCLFLAIFIGGAKQIGYEPELIQRASHPQDSDASLVASRPVNSTVGRLNLELANHTYRFGCCWCR